jgi:DNA repair exonuclease SbcCD ATPase subunit
MARHEPRSSTLLCQLQRLKTLLSSPIETLVEDPEEVKSIFEEIKHHLPVSLQLYLCGPVTALSVYGSKVKSARQRIDLRCAQLPLKADIADKCQQLNAKKSAFDARNDTSVRTTALEALRKELEALEERVRATKQLIHEEEALLARSKEEAASFKTQLQADLAEIRALSKQLVMGTDEEDAADIAAADRIRVDALRALEAFLQ